MPLCFFVLQGSIVNTLQYKNWRNTGVAFQIREGSYDVPNKTLASSLLLKHVNKIHDANDFCSLFR